jgi:outer membrane protein
MKKNVYLIAGFVLMYFVMTGANVWAAESKIGFINLREIIQNTTAGKKAGEELKKLVDKKAEQIKAAENELKKMKDDLDKQASIMTAAVRKDKETTYQRKLRDYQLLVEDSNRELKAKDEEMFTKLLPDIAKIITAIGEKDKYTLVIDVSTMPVAYYAKENDFSKKVIEEFNKLRK